MGKESDSADGSAAPTVIDLEPGDPEVGGLQIRLPTSELAEVRELLARFDVEYRETVGKSAGADIVLAIIEGVKALSLAEVVRAWVSRNDNKTVKFDGIELTGYRGKEVDLILDRIDELRAQTAQRQVEYEASVAAIEVEMAKEGLSYRHPPELPGSDTK